MKTIDIIRAENARRVGIAGQYGSRLVGFAAVAHGIAELTLAQRSDNMPIKFGTRMADTTTGRSLATAHSMRSSSLLKSEIIP